MTRVFPFPLLSAALFGMWVLLTGFSPGHVLLAGLVALTIPRVMLRQRLRCDIAQAFTLLAQESIEKGGE